MPKRTLAILTLLLACEQSRACPLCKDSASNQEGTFAQMHDSQSTTGENISGGLNTSIYFMFAGLIGVGAMISTVMVRGARASNATAQKKRD